MTKRILCLILLVFTILLTACSAPPPPEPPTYDFEFEYIAKDINVGEEPNGKHNRISANHINDAISGAPFSGDSSIYIVEKTGSYSYYWRVPGATKEYLEIAFTVSTMFVKQVLYVGETFSNPIYEKGDSFEIIEAYGETPTGEFIYPTYLKKEEVSPWQLNECWVDNGKQYFMILTNKGIISSEDTFYYLEREGYTENDAVYKYELPHELFNGKYKKFFIYDFSQEAYAEAIEYLENPLNGNPDRAYYNSVKELWEANSHLVTDDNSSTTIIFTLGFAAIFLCIIAVGIILIKHSKTTPSGTPPTVEQNSPDAQDTPDTPVEEAKTAAPPDVTEPPGPPKEE